MITKKLIHDIITFCSNYINNKNILFAINKYPTFIIADFSVWSLDNKDLIDNQIGTINSCIHDIDDFKEFKEKVLNKLPKLLEQLKEK